MAEEILPYNIKKVEASKPQKPLFLILFGLAVAIILLVIVSVFLLNSKNSQTSQISQNTQEINVSDKNTQQIVDVTPHPGEDYQVSAKKYVEAVGKIIIDDDLVAAFQNNPKLAAEGFSAKISAGPQLDGLDKEASRAEVRRFLIEIATYHSDIVSQGGEIDTNLYPFIVQLLYMAKLGNSPYISSTSKASWKVAIKAGKEVTYNLIGHAKVHQKELKEYLDTTYRRDEFKGF